MNPSDQARQIQALVQREISKFGERLQDRGITWEGPDLDILDTNLQSYTAELRVTFYADNDIFDIIEYFVYRDGVRSVTEAEWCEWVREVTEEVLAKRGESF